MQWNLKTSSPVYFGWSQRSNFTGFVDCCVSKLVSVEFFSLFFWFTEMDLAVYGLKVVLGPLFSFQVFLYLFLALA